MKKLRPPAYNKDLAYIHDVGYGGFAESAAPGVLRILDEAGIHGGLVVDLGCGSGIWARHLTDAGYEVVGVDISPAMIELARRRAPAAKFFVESLFAFELPPCHAITALGEVVCYQFDAGRSLHGLIQLAFAALEPGGVLIFDVVEVGRNRDWPSTFREGSDWAALVRCEYDAEQDHLIRHITTFRKVGALYRRDEETHRVQLYRQSDVAEMLRASGFGTRIVRRFGDYDLLQSRVGFVARKPKRSQLVPRRQYASTSIIAASNKVADR